MSLGVFIGRFQPFHSGHKEIVDYGLSKYTKVLVVIGDTGGPRTVKDPWSYKQRAEMIELVYKEEIQSGRLRLVCVEDTKNHQEWVNCVCYAARYLEPLNSKTFLLGYKKDRSSYYLDWFSEWRKDLSDKKNLDIDATNIRDAFFSGVDYEYKVPKEIVPCLEQSKESLNKYKLFEEHDYIKSYKEQWAEVPFPPVFVTVDFLVYCQKKVLLVKRNQDRGYGLWALPGGYLDHDETLLAAAIRELREETAIDLTDFGSFVAGPVVVDRINRSFLGRTITHVYVYKPKVFCPEVAQAGDGCSAIAWKSIKEIKNMKRVMFSDHQDIILDILEGNNV